MGRLFRFIGNRPDLGARLLKAQKRYIATRPDDTPVGWGVGFYHGDEVLLRRRPIAVDQDISVMLDGIRATDLIGQVGTVEVAGAHRKHAAVSLSQLALTHSWLHRR